MLIGVLADTHDRLPAIDRAMQWFAERRVEAVIHAGDLVAPFAARRLLGLDAPLHAVFGNNDGELRGLKAVLPQIQAGPLKLELDGRAILVHHFIEWCAPADLEQSEVVITGHTHQAVNRRDGARLLLNPGECCGWVNHRCTVALLDTSGPDAEICELSVP